MNQNHLLFLHFFKIFYKSVNFGKKLNKDRFKIQVWICLREEYAMPNWNSSSSTNLKFSIDQMHAIIPKASNVQMIFSSSRNSIPFHGSNKALLLPDIFYWVCLGPFEIGCVGWKQGVWLALDWNGYFQVFIFRSCEFLFFLSFKGRISIFCITDNNKSICLNTWFSYSLSQPIQLTLV